MILQLIADTMRLLADRLDPAGAPRALGYHFTFESGKGLVFNDQGRGCRLWYLGDAEYDLAHTEADKPTSDLPDPQWMDDEGHVHPITPEAMMLLVKAQMRRDIAESCGDINQLLDEFLEEGRDGDSVGLFQQINTTFDGIAKGTAQMREDHAIDKAVGDAQSHAHQAAPGRFSHPRRILGRDDSGTPIYLTDAKGNTVNDYPETDK